MLPGNKKWTRFFAYAASIVAMVHVSALLGGVLADRLFSQGPLDWGPPLAGMVAGSFAGVLFGALLGRYAERNVSLFWLMQLTAVGFLIFLPLM